MARMLSTAASKSRWLRARPRQQWHCARPIAPDIVLVDVEMAGGKGWERLAEVRGEPGTLTCASSYTPLESNRSWDWVGWTLGTTATRSSVHGYRGASSELSK